MVSLEVNGKKGSFKVNLPTSFDELTKDYIKSVTNHIVPAPNYSIIGLVFKEKLSTVAFVTNKNKKTVDIPIVPIFVKAGETDDNFINSININEKLIISPSDIMLGHHISAPENLLTINNLVDILNGDIIIYNKLMNSNKQCYFVEFKLIPNCNIHGVYKSDVNKYENPFITKVSDNAKKIIIPEKAKIIL